MGIRNRRLTTRALAACLALTMLAGCSGGADRQAETGIGDRGSTATVPPPATDQQEATATAEPPTPRDWPELPDVDSSGLPGLDIATVSDQDAQIHLVVPRLAGHPALSGSLLAAAEERAEEFRADYAVDGDAGMTATPFITGQWRLVAASKDILGVETETYVNAGASSQTAWTVDWYQPRTGTLLEPWDLVEEDHRVGVMDVVVTELEAEVQGFDEERAREFLRDGRVRLGFDGDGRLFVGFDEYAVAPGSESGPSVVLGQAVEEGWLSELGEQARRATMDLDASAVPEQPAGSGSDAGADNDEPTHVPTAETTQEPSPSPTAAPVSPSAGDVNCAVERCVALTFDDGPSSGLTPRLLDILSAEGVAATFYVTGSQVNANPGIVARQLSEGHQVGNHTWSHPSLPGLGTAGVRDELARTNQAIRAATGASPTTMRPPYGASDETVRAAAAAEGLAQVTWDVDTRDWEHKNPARTLGIVQQTIRPGSIILMHDVHETTVQAVPEVVAWLRSQGYRMVTVNQLVGQLEPGQMVSRRG
ncbi:polysaccharide deacetylase family protein [Ornithinimicrobium sp. Y1847]|uniref:polysaccharide deacetylase family protein n=1 Tax=Ornithinimicrobium sp. Y1847 TaxID=3405419 RepID=UPI003B6765EC